MNITARLYGISVPLEIDIGDDGSIRSVSAPRAKETYQRLVETVWRQAAGGKTLVDMLHRNAEIGDLLRLLMDIEEQQRKAAREQEAA